MADPKWVSRFLSKKVGGGEFPMLSPRSERWGGGGGASPRPPPIDAHVLQRDKRYKKQH